MASNRMDRERNEPIDPQQWQALGPRECLRLVKEMTIRREPFTKLMRALAASGRLLGGVETSTLSTTCRVFSGEPQVGKSRYIERFTYSQTTTSQEDADGN